MRKFVILSALFLCLPNFSALASDPRTFELIYRQENVVSDELNTKSDLMITVINLSGGEARDIVVSIPVMNPYLFIDSPVFITTIPNSHQAEILHAAEMPNDLIALSEPEEKLMWRIEYADETGERVAVQIKGVHGQ
jgi:hypothetical protein